MIENIYTALPKSLTERKIWATWRREGEKKPPYQVDGYRAYVNDDDTWTSFEAAKSAYEAGGFDGIGVFLDDLACVDLDKVRDAATGELKPFAAEIVEQVNGWTEVSTSGTGVHIFATRDADFKKCSEPHGTSKVEIFRHSRFMAMTGHQIQNGVTEIVDRTLEIRRVHEKYVGKVAPAPEAERSASTSSNIDIASRLQIAYRAKNGAAIKALMDGDASMHGEDDSSADLALCCHLAFYLDKEPGLIEQAFGQSALAHRDKWKKRADYRRRTILAAITMTTSIYQVEPVKPKSMTSFETIGLIARQPVESFASVEERYLVQPEVPEGFFVLVTAKPSAGKSTLVLSWCYEVAKSGRKVLYLDRDNPLGVAQSRIKRFGGSHENMIYWGSWNVDAAGEPLAPPDFGSDVFLDYAREHKPLIVFDTFRAFFQGDDENDNSKISAELKKLKKLTSLGATVILIHHAAKADSSNSSGAGAFEANCDIAMKVESVRNMDGHLTSATVKFFKSRLCSPDQAYTFDDKGRPVRATTVAKELGEPELAALFDEIKPKTSTEFWKEAKVVGFTRDQSRKYFDSRKQEAA